MRFKPKKPKKTENPIFSVFKKKIPSKSDVFIILDKF